VQDQAVVAALGARVVVVAARELDAVQDDAARHDLIRPALADPLEPVDRGDLDAVEGHQGLDHVGQVQHGAELDPLGREAGVIAGLKGVKLAKGSEEVFYPGELEARNDIRNRAEGLLLPADTLADLAKLARDMRVTHELPI